MKSATSFTLVGAISIVMWGAILPLLRLSSERAGMFSTLLVVQGVAGALGVIAVAASGRFPRTSSVYLSPYFYLRWALFVAHVLCIYTAVSVVERADMSAVVFANYMWPTLALVYALVISKIKVAKPILFAIGIGLTVVAIIIEFAWPVITVALSSGSLLAILIAFVGANSWGLYSAVTRRFGDVSGGSAVTPLYPLSCGAIAALMIVIGGGDRVDSSLADLKISVPALFAALFNFIAYLCWDIGLRKGNIFSLTLLADFIPWMSLAAVSLLLGVELNWRTLMSALLLVAGAVIARLSAMRREIA